MKAKPPLTSLTPSQRAALILNPKRNYIHNFTSSPVPSKQIHTASSRFATA